MALFTKEEALRYHSDKRKGKLEVISVKPCDNQKHLSMAYSPGVAEACREIAADTDKVYEYTNKGNLVAVVSNGTAVLGLGNIGPEGGKPVMEGKGVLFKIFSDIDVYDLNINATTPDEIVSFCKMLEPTFGGINLEDIKSPECFEIEQRLIEEMNIPVFHDDQHGTAIISGAGILNALEIAGKDITDIKVVVSGAGASAIACSEFYVSMGVKRQNIFMFDSRGLIHVGREGLNEFKKAFAQDKDYGSLADVMVGTDMFLGLSVKDAINQEMVKTMAENAIIFACANPDPEIAYEDVKAVRPDIVMGTGRSDYPNQVNNVLGFPFIFRGALDCRASAINEEMKIACSKALADLAKEPVSQEVCDAYGVDALEYGIDYIIPKPLDPRVLTRLAPAVAKAAMETGVARVHLDLEQYAKDLEVMMTASKLRTKGVVDTFGYDF
ncbi:malic enzyme-like NAD(P)-binding protein [Pseudodesulfovibrio piezophilus]|uniref:Malate dehydrogenase (Oxaloacetate-decarboxylating) (NADP(+)) n=1 Tax=Pseudodesulfovibrio piezophilus (strain DSM 21447 / JCM 15486 / C1TLV30) TaxID=1322246 RepID=M1WW63_PSEP2|nr:malic enzyme-like NAD(P)-binding protein [Pseudodesulfovibrio piezophilus]CCH48958.1 Malate dehydrogenase (Oxaloacetate-decarboxylating) (NADP(+)) [Pseudodesulfovibrio piezophilus C1TLV30]